MTQDLSRLRVLYQQCLLLDEQEFFLFPGSVNHYDSSWKTSLCQTLLTRTRHTLNAFMDPGFTSGFLLQPLEEQLKKEFSSKAVLNIFYDSYIVYLHNQGPSDGDSYLWVRDFLQALSACKKLLRDAGTVCGTRAEAGKTVPGTYVLQPGNPPGTAVPSE